MEKEPRFLEHINSVLLHTRKKKKTIKYKFLQLTMLQSPSWTVQSSVPNLS